MVRANERAPQEEGPVEGAPLVSFLASRCRAGSAVSEDASSHDDDLGLYVIADGMGGYGFGHDASKVALETCRSVIASRAPRSGVRLEADDETCKSLLADAVSEANVELCKMAAERRAPMGSTVTVALVRGNRLYGAHVGDCRLYLIDDGFVVRALTREHRAATGGPQLERSLGRSLNVACDTVDMPLPERFALLLCTDGVWSSLPPEAIADAARNQRAKEVADVIVQAAADHGGDDDATAIYVESDAMRRCKEKLVIERLEVAAEAGDMQPESLVRLLEYYTKERDPVAVAKHFPGLLKLNEVREQSQATLGRALDVLRDALPDEYVKQLRVLFGMRCLPEARVPDLATACARHGDVGDAALKLYQQSLRVDPSNLDVRTALGLSLLRRGETTEAIRELRAPFSSSPERQRAILHSLKTRWREGGQKAALELSVAAGKPGTAAKLEQFLREASGTGDRDAEHWAEGLLVEVAKAYPRGADQALADEVIRRREEARESVRLKRAIGELTSDRDRWKEGYGDVDAKLKDSEARIRQLEAEVEREAKRSAALAGKLARSSGEAGGVSGLQWVVRWFRLLLAVVVGLLAAGILVGWLLRGCVGASPRPSAAAGQGEASGSPPVPPRQPETQGSAAAQEGKGAPMGVAPQQAGASSPAPVPPLPSETSASKAPQGGKAAPIGEDAKTPLDRDRKDQR